MSSIDSSMMDLMVDEDIDFTCYVPSPVDIHQTMLFAEELLKLPQVTSLKIKNYLENPEYYQFKVNIINYSYNGRLWKITFSFQVKTPKLIEGEVDKIQWVKQHLTSDTKCKILMLKYESRLRKEKIPGSIIYDAVFLHNVKTYEDLKHHITNKPTPKHA